MTSIFQLIRDPYTFVEEIVEWTSEARSLESNRLDVDAQSGATSSHNLVDST